MSSVTRRTVDLSGYPNLVVIYLGMRLNVLRGLRTVMGFGSKVGQAMAGKPDGLLLHENVIYSLFPMHAGFRQYWRDYDALERWARSGVHQQWWQGFMKHAGGVGFWHEAYFAQGGMEAVYDDMVAATGFMKFAPIVPARGPMFSARTRLKLKGQETLPTPVPENAIYEYDGAGPGAGSL